MKNRDGQLTFLLVDDNSVDNYIHERMIELSGTAKKIISHSSGKSALEYLREHKDSPDLLPDIIFLDINMPVIDGFVFLHEFDTFPEQVKNKCKIHILSSSSNQDDIRTLIENKYVLKYHLKPLQEEALQAIHKDHIYSL